MAPLAYTFFRTCSSADTAGRLHIVDYFSLVILLGERSNTHNSQIPLSLYESSFWKDSDLESGDGAVGTIQMRISACAMVASVLFNSLIPSPYAAPCRNFTLRPFEDLPSAFQHFFIDHDKAANSSFLTLKKLLESSAGDFRGFQAAFEESR